MTCEMFECIFEDTCDRLKCPAIDFDADDCVYFSCDYCSSEVGCVRSERFEEEEGS